jgi:hypothetical protein
MVEYSLDGVELEDVLFPVRVIGSTLEKWVCFVHGEDFCRDWRERKAGFGLFWIRFGGRFS